MPRVYQCIEWNESTRACDGAAWVETASIVDALPSVEQAQEVGLAVFASLVILASFSLLLPSRSNSDD